jgi:hypothetical protein
MSQAVVTIAGILFICLLFSSCVSASSTNQTKNDTISGTSTLSEISINSINPTSGKVGQEVSFNMTGSGFVKGTRIYLEKEINKRTKIISAILVNVTSPSALSGKFDLPKDAAKGDWNIVSKHDSLVANSNINFTITA